MDNLINKVLGSSKTASPTPAAAPDADFADFQSLSADPSPASLYASTASSNPVLTGAVPTGNPSFTPRPFTKWYRVWERTSLEDFKQEAYILPFLVAILVAHLWGTRANRRKARKWISSVAPVLQTEFAQVGFKKQQGNSDLVRPEDALKEESLTEFASFASGRQNVAFIDLRITLLKRYNPALVFAETVMGFFFDSVPAPIERMNVTLFPFDGHEKDLVPGGPESSVPSSSYDGFVWAVVHKEKMSLLRDERYDLSLTSTKDHPKLPATYTIMSESAEVTDALLTPELIKAIENAGDELESLIITDQPVEAPSKLDELVSRKRLHLATAASASSTELLSVFIRLADHLPKAAHFRPEVQRKLKATRDAETNKLRKVDDEEKAEARKLSSDKKKREDREKLLKSMTADQQRKYLDKEREKERRKGDKRRTMKG